MKLSFAVLQSCVILLIGITTVSVSAQSNKIIYSIKGKPVTYYKLSGDERTFISVTGPGKLEVTARARFSSSSPDSLSFSISYQLDNKFIKVFTAKNVVRAPGSIFIEATKARPSIARTFEIPLEPDVHEIGLLLLRGSPPVDFTYRVIPYEQPEWMDLKSINDTTHYHLLVDNSADQKYYPLSNAQPQRFKVKGPTTLRILTRLEYDYTMQGLMSYRIRVKVNDSIAGTFKMEATPSKSAVYVNDKKHIPGTLEKFYLDVPEGEFIYEFSLLDKKFNALIRVSKEKKKIRSL